MTSADIILAKTERLRHLIAEVRHWTETIADKTILNRSCERNLEIMVELAADLNVTVLLERDARTPDSYKGSFRMLEHAGIVDHDLAERLVDAVELRNIIVHEYDFEADADQFLDSLLRSVLPSYETYIAIMIRVATDSSREEKDAAD